MPLRFRLYDRGNEGTRCNLLFDAKFSVLTLVIGGAGIFCIYFLKQLLNIYQIQVKQMLSKNIQLNIRIKIFSLSKLNKTLTIKKNT